MRRLAVDHSVCSGNPTPWSQRLEICHLYLYAFKSTVHVFQVIVIRPRFLGTVYFEKWCSQHRIQLFLSVLTVDHYILFYSSTPYNSCLSGQCHQAPFLETVYFEKSCLQSAFNSFPRLTFHLIGQANTSSQDHHLLQNLTERSALTTNGNPNLTTLKWDGLLSVGGGDKIWKSKFEKSNIHLTFHGYVETLFILLVPHFFWKKSPTKAKKLILTNFPRFCL